MNCRFRVKREAPFDIPAGATEFIDCTLEPTSPGSFEVQLHVFVDDKGAREVTITVKGHAVDARNADAKSQP